MYSKGKKNVETNVQMSPITSQICILIMMFVPKHCPFVISHGLLVLSLSLSLFPTLMCEFVYTNKLFYHLFTFYEFLKLFQAQM